jgi:hypothetical protein
MSRPARERNHLAQADRHIRAVIRHFQEHMPYGLGFIAAAALLIIGTQVAPWARRRRPRRGAISRPRQRPRKLHGEM